LYQSIFFHLRYSPLILANLLKSNSTSNMRYQIPLTVTFAATVLASPRPITEVVQVREVAKRQDVSSFDFGTLIPSACLPPSTLDPAPTPPADILTALATWTDPCETPSFTGDAKKEYESYTSALSSWADNVEPALSSWQKEYSTACPYASLATLDTSVTLALSDFTNLASCGATGAKTTGGADATGTGGADATGAGSTGAAPQQTAFAAAAGLLAGVAGVVAIL
jgi:hypothetical protein